MRYKHREHKSYVTVIGHQQIGRKLTGLFRAGRNVYGFLRVMRPTWPL